MEYRREVHTASPATSRTKGLLSNQKSSICRSEKLAIAETTILLLSINYGDS